LEPADIALAENPRQAKQSGKRHGLPRRVKPREDEEFGAFAEKRGRTGVEPLPQM
jgi:hypothetical protein